jgi:putative hydroxymethylpyrimidine transport system ATP-binding protein
LELDERWHSLSEVLDARADRARRTLAGRGAMSHPPPTVRLEGARLVYGPVPVFDGLDLCLAGGRWTALLGQSGVGKTSLLRLLAGLTDRAQSAGRVTCDDGLAIAGRISYMAQQDLLLPWLSALENVTLGQRLRGEQRQEPGSEDRARALLADVGLHGRADERPSSLSGGMRQRVAIARTLMEDRPVVLMDEPFSALDAITRHRLQELAAKLLAGRTVLVVTHDPMEALRLGHRVLVLADAPARLESARVPDSPTPRAVDDPQVVALHGELLSRLSAGARAA